MNRAAIGPICLPVLLAAPRNGLVKTTVLACKAFQQMRRQPDLRTASCMSARRSKRIQRRRK